MNQEKIFSEDQTAIEEVPLLAAKGFCMGAADVVPGVSGGTMALILGIYPRLIDAIKSFDIRVLRLFLKGSCREAAAKAHWLFLLSVLTGIFAAVIFFTRIVGLPRLMTTHPEPVYGLFFGLILASIWFVYRDSGIDRPRLGWWIVLGTLAGLRIVTLVPTETPEHPGFIFFSGMLAITAMILPGISGSFILLILRQYEHILSQFALLGGVETWSALLVLLPFALGLLTGIILFSRFLSWLLHRWRTSTYLVLTGFMIGSLWIIWPWQERAYEMVRGKQRMLESRPVLPEIGSSEFLWGLGMMVVGAAAVVLLELSSRRPKTGDAGGERESVTGKARE